MIRDHFDDPAHRWAPLLKDLSDRQRETVVRALRDSVGSGFPADADGVRILVAYAQGQISARQYASQMLESLGFLPAGDIPAPAPQRWHPVRDSDPRRAPARTPDPWRDSLSSSRPAPADDALPQWRDVRREPWPGPSRDARQDGDTLTRSPRATRQQAVQAYVSGQIPMEEFLRLSGS